MGVTSGQTRVRVAKDRAIVNSHQKFMHVSVLSGNQCKRAGGMSPQPRVMD